MAKWKCEICGNEFENFHAQGFDSKIYCPLCYFKKKNQELKKQNNNFKTALDESQEVIIDYIKEIEELKKRLEENKKPLRGIFAQVNDDMLLRSCGAMQSEIDGYKTQQKEFIKYLEKRYKDVTSVISSFGSNTDLLYGKKDMIEEIIQKYKEIIGDDKR